MIPPITDDQLEEVRTICSTADALDVGSAAFAVYHIKALILRLEAAERLIQQGVDVIESILIPNRCRCTQPVILCDDQGCRCQICHLPERFDG